MDICFILTPIATIAGYFIRVAVADKSTCRKEDWEKINKLAGLINELADAAQEFYCSPPETQEARRKLGLKIQGMLRRIRQDALNLSFIKPPSYLEGYNQRIRQATTLELNETDKGALAETDPIIEGIEIACGSYIGAIQLAYARKYRPVDLKR